MKNIVQLSAYFNMGSGILLLAFWYLYVVLLPYGQLSNTLSLLVLNRNWVLVNILGSLGAMLGIIGLVGLYISLGEDASMIATTGFVIALVGSILMFVTLLRDTLVWPILAAHDPSLLDFSGPIYTSKTFLPFFIFSGILYTLGNIIFGLSLARSPLYPFWAGHLLAWGALLFGFGNLFAEWQAIIRSAGITAYSIGLFWLGFLMR